MVEKSKKECIRNANGMSGLLCIMRDLETAFGQSMVLIDNPKATQTEINRASQEVLRYSAEDSTVCG